MLTTCDKRKPLWILLSCLLCTNLQAGRIWYVDSSYEMDGSGDLSAEEGASWQRPYKSISDVISEIKALSRAESHEIRVAQGLYSERVRLERLGASRAIRLRGGYAGSGAVDPNIRDIRLFETVLSGDIDRDDKLGHTRNNVPVVSIWQVDIVTLDGLTITDGYRMVEFYEYGGSALAISSEGNYSIVDCTFKNNHGVLAIRHSRGVTAQYLRCLFKDNRGLNGSVIYNKGSKVVFENCVFSENRSAAKHLYVGVMENHTASTPGGSCYTTLRNCLFYRNYVRFGASILGNFNTMGRNCMVTMENCIFSGNQSGGISYHYPDFERPQGGSIYNGPSCSISMQNSLFIGNRAQTGSCIINSGHIALNGCIMWDNDTPVLEGENIQVDYSIIQGGYPGFGNLDVDPHFTRPGYWDTNDTPDDLNDDIWIDGDYHLKSQGGRWDVSSDAWVYDDTTSPCIDAGDPNHPVGWEIFPNGGIVNIGAYGGTDEASKSWFDAEPCTTVMAGDINGDCRVDDADLALLQSHWLWVYAPPVEPNEPPSSGGGGDGRR